MDSIRSRRFLLENYEQKLDEYRENQAESLLMIGELYLDEDEPEKALENLQEAKKIYQKIKNPEGEAYTYDLMGDAYLSTENITPAKKHYQKAFQIYSKLDYNLKDEIKEKIDKIKKLESNLNINPEKDLPSRDEDLTVVNDEETVDKPPGEKPQTKDWNDGNILEVEDYPAKESHELTDRLDNLVMLLDQSGLYSIYSKDPNNLEIFQEALKTAELIEDHNNEGILHLMLGDAQLKEEKPVKALKHFKKALKIFKTNNNEKGEAVALLLIGAEFFFLDKMDEMYEVFRNSLQILEEYDHKREEELALELLEILST